MLMLETGIGKQISIANLHKAHIFFRAVGGSPGHGSPSLGDKKRAKRSHLPKQFVVGISYAAKIPLRSVALALQGSDSDHAQDALRVLDIVLRQQQAKRYGERNFTLSLSLQCHSDCNYCLLYPEVAYSLGNHFSVMTVET
jgi:hypothetical protein